jgi:hypothetical protein
MPDLNTNLETVAAEPIEATVDGRTAKNQPLPDLIAAETFIGTAAALQGTNRNGGKRSGWGRVRIARAVPPGAGPC